MAVQVTIEFTDAQWELIKANLLLPNEYNDLAPIETEEEFISGVQKFVANSVQGAITTASINTAAQQAQDAFNV